MNTPTTVPSGELLQWRTRATVRQLLLAMLTSLAIALCSGGLLWLGGGHDNFRQLLLITHLAAGLLTCLFFFPFVTLHWRDGGEPWPHLFLPFALFGALRRDTSARHRLLGIALLWNLFVVLGSGLLVMLPAVAYLAGEARTLPYGAHVWLLQLHRWPSLLLLALLFLHMPKEDRA